MEPWERIERFFEIWFNAPEEISNWFKRMQAKKSEKVIKRIKELCIERAMLESKRKLLKPDAPMNPDLNSELYNIVGSDLKLYKAVSFELITGKQESIESHIGEIDAELKKLRLRPNTRALIDI